MGSGSGTSSGSEGAKRQDFRLKEQRLTYGARGQGMFGNGLSEEQKRFERNISAAQELEKRAEKGSLPIPGVSGVALRTIGSMALRQQAGVLRTDSVSATPVTSKFGESGKELVVGVVSGKGVYSGRQQFDPTKEGTDTMVRAGGEMPIAGQEPQVVSTAPTKSTLSAAARKKNLASLGAGSGSAQQRLFFGGSR